MKQILLLLADGFEILEASVFIDVMGWNLLEGDQSTKLYTCGLRKEISSSFGQKLIADLLADEVDIQSFDALAIPGGFEEYGYFKDAYDDRFLSLIREFRANNKIISSICLGALPIGKSGILKNKKATTYNNPVRREALAGYEINVLSQAIVVDDNITTSWNPSTAVDVAFLLLEELTSRRNADEVRQLMGFQL
jgi:4-methyl-5(b-hydroxyethyl)-thiazole monophosphate biosynthesis